MDSIAVYCGSRVGDNPRYASTARALGAALAAHGYRLVYGGGNVGLMGEVADAALTSGGEVVGVMPTELVAREIAHAGLTRLEVCLLYTSPSPRDGLLSRMPSSA